MAELMKLENYVTNILTLHEESRCDDQLLYTIYMTDSLRRVYPSASRREIEVKMLFVMQDGDYRVKHGIAGFESVSRCRRKVQEKCDWLRPSTAALMARKELTKKFRKYARGEMV